MTAATFDQSCQQTREIRARNRLLQEQLREKRLARALQVTESTWLEPYAELLIRLRQREYLSRTPNTLHDRRYGRDFPFYQNEQDLAFIRQPSRFLCASNGYAIGLLEGLTSYIVGEGFTYKWTPHDPNDTPLADAAQIVTDQFLKRNSWAGGEQPSLEEERFQGACTDGEDFLIHFPRSDGTVDVRPFYPEQIRQPPNSIFEEWSFGVYAEPDDPAKPLAYWGVTGETANDGEEYEADRVVHWRRNVRRTMKRGLPDFFATTHDVLRLAGLLLENLGETGAQQAAIVGVRQHAGSTKEQVQRFADDAADGLKQVDYLTERYGPALQMRKGRWEDIPDNMEYAKGPIAENSPIHIQILQALLRGAGVRWNAPEWLSSADASNSNYSNSLTAESPFVRTGTRRQNQAKQIYGVSVDYALRHWCRVHGGLQVNGVLTPEAEVFRKLKLDVDAPSLETHNKLEEAQVLAIERQNGVTSVPTWQGLVGRDPDEEQRKQDEWKAANPDQGGTPLAVPQGFAQKQYPES